MTPARPWMPLVILTAAALLAAGCDGGRTEILRLQRELQNEQETVEDLREQLARTKADLEDQRRKTRTLQDLGDKRKDVLFTVSRIELGRYTGGVDTDDNPGDDAVKVFLQPIDQHGSVIKAAGRVTVRLFDLGRDPNEVLLGQRVISPEQLAGFWSGGFGVYHFSFPCRWDRRVPAGDTVTVRVEFIDYLTGETFSAQKQVSVSPVAEDESAAK